MLASLEWLQPANSRLFLHSCLVCANLCSVLVIQVINNCWTPGSSCKLGSNGHVNFIYGYFIPHIQPIRIMEIFQRSLQ